MIVTWTLVALFVCVALNAAKTRPWLRVTLVEQPAAWLSAMTLRRAVLSAAFIVLLMLLASSLPLDLALLAAGDSLAYFELVAGLSALAFGAKALALSRMSARHMLQPVWSLVRRLPHSLALRRGAGHRRARGKRHVAARSASVDEDPAAVWALA